MPAEKILLLLIGCLSLTGPVQAAQGTGVNDLADLSLEQLSSIEVVSVSGRARGVQDAPASIHVITAQDIRRSAALSLPEALRLAPNLQVAQVSSGQWAISARGFNNPIANKLLVLIDGRVVYSTLFSGVFWDANEVILEDVERIEVISGPAGTLWGANAVNGVINVITRPAEQTQGALVSVARSASGGRQVARWGTAIGPDAHLRLYALATDRDNTQIASTGAERADASSRQQLGFRADWEQRDSKLTVQGDVYRAGGPVPNGLSPDQHGGNLLARWDSRFEGGSPYRVQAYVDVVDRDETTVFRNRASVADLQFSHEPAVRTGQLLWGAGVRTARDVNDPTALVRFVPEQRRLTWSNVFAQYQLPLGRRWELTTGLKAERNSYTGTELMPNVRLAFRHSPQATTWAGVSRAVRAPSRIDREFFFPGGPPFLIAGGSNFQSETADVLELGHRGQHGLRLSYAVTAYRQQYKGLRAGIPGQVPATVENQIEGPSTGLEAWAQWQAARDWRLFAGYTYHDKQLRFSSGATSAVSIANLGNDPRHQWQLRSSLNVGARGEFDVFVRHVSRLPAPAVPSYTAVDARMAWRASRELTLAVVGQNLFDREHVEWFDNGVSSQLRRRVYLQAIWR